MKKNEKKNKTQNASLWAQSSLKSETNAWKCWESQTEVVKQLGYCTSGLSGQIKIERKLLKHSACKSLDLGL